MYELDHERLRLHQGVLNKKVNDIELYRVTAYELDQPIWLRIFGLSNINVITSDPKKPLIVLHAVPAGSNVCSLIRDHKERHRKATYVTDLNIHHLP